MVLSSKQIHHLFETLYLDSQSNCISLIQFGFKPIPSVLMTVVLSVNFQMEKYYFGSSGFFLFPYEFQDAWISQFLVTIMKMFEATHLRRKDCSSSQLWGFKWSHRLGIWGGQGMAMVEDEWRKACMAIQKAERVVEPKLRLF